MQNRGQSDDTSDELQQLLQSQCDAFLIEIQDLKSKNDTLKKSLDHAQNVEGKF